MGKYLRKLLYFNLSRVNVSKTVVVQGKIWNIFGTRSVQKVALSNSDQISFDRPPTLVQNYFGGNVLYQRRPLQRHTASKHVLALPLSRIRVGSNVPYFLLTTPNRTNLFFPSKTRARRGEDVLEYLIWLSCHLQQYLWVFLVLGLASSTSSS